MIKEKNSKFTIEFDKAPAFVYINVSGNGCGQVYIDGEQFKGLQRVKIEAETNTEKIKPLNYSIQHILGEVQPDGKIIPKIAVTGNMDEPVKEVV